MTAEQTRKMIIEIERRLQTIDPTMELVGKIETDDIVSFLNQYQLQFVKQAYLAQDKVQNNTRSSVKLYDYVRSLNTKATLTKCQTQDDPESTLYELPEGYYMYIRSTSNVVVNYKSDEQKTISNQMLDQYSVQELKNNIYNKGNIIRKPILVLDDDLVRVYVDEYTTLNSVDMIYLRKPSQIDYYDVPEQHPCELPEECSEELISGTVDLYFSYKYKVSLASQAARQKAKEQAQKQDDTDDQKGDSES